MSDIIEIVCGIDSNYAPHLAVMLESLAEYNARHRFRVNVLHDNIPDELRKRVEDCTGEIEIKWINAVNHAVLGVEGVGYISRAAYLRLMIPEVLDPALKRVLYLDVDIIINGDILGLWNTPLGNKACAAVADAWVNADEFALKWHLDAKGRYFNSGILLFDLDKLRSGSYMEKAIKIVTAPDHTLQYVDQDALNIVLWNDWLEIDPGWNFQRRFLFDNYAVWNARSPEKYQPAIIHFTEAEKPWNKIDWHDCRWLYLRMLLRTPFIWAMFKSGQIDFRYICKSWAKWTFKRLPMFRLPRRGDI